MYNFSVILWIPNKFYDTRINLVLFFFVFECFDATCASEWRFALLWFRTRVLPIHWAQFVDAFKLLD